MKKYVAMLLGLAMVVGLCVCFTGCSKDKTNIMDEVKDSQTEENKNTDNKISAGLKEKYDVDIEELDWKDYAVNIDGKTLEMPVKSIWLYQMGFEEMKLEEPAHGVKKGETTKATSTYKDCEFAFELSPLNNYGESSPIKECYVISFTIEDISKLKDNDIKLLLPGGLDVYSCSEDDLIKTYGEQTKKEGKTFVWSKESGLSLEITMKNKKEIKSIKIKNNQN